MKNNRPLLIFLVVQALFVGGVGLAFAWRLSLERRQAKMPPLRNQPLHIEPTITDYAPYQVVVTDEQLSRVLKILRPRELGRNTSVNHLDHALRFWGLKARFANPKFLDGEELRRRLIDHRRFTEVFGPEVEPLLVVRANGTVGVRMQQGRATSSHLDHTLACLAEVGTPLDFPVFTDQGQTDLRAIFDGAFRSFSLNQVEYEWTAVAFAIYLDLPNAETTWLTREGQQMNFNRLARRIMRQEQPQGVCFGNHRLHALTVFLRVDDQTPILDAATRQSIIDYLKQMTMILVKHQSPDGFWHQQWPLRAATATAPKETGYDTLSNRLLATGHALEWWIYAPAEVQPPRDVLVRAGQWLARSIQNLSDDQVKSMYPFLTHAGRSLALWRGVDPADFVHRN